MPAVPLRRNRDFVLLQAGQLLSNVGTQSTAIAYPLLVLAQTHSPVRAGVVSFARALPLVEKDGNLASEEKTKLVKTCTDGALGCLRQALDKKLRDPGRLLEDRPLSVLGDRPEFQELLSRIKD